MASITETILGNPVTKIQEQSSNVLDVFTKTIKDLETLNISAEAELLRRDDIIKKAQEEQAILNATKTKNLTVISKINKIFED
jgi:hypothetical protein